MNQVIIPENYHSVLSMYETQDAIGIIKEMMQKKLSIFQSSSPSYVLMSSIEQCIHICDGNRQLAWRHRLYILWQNGNVWHFTATIFVLERGF